MTRAAPRPPRRPARPARLAAERLEPRDVPALFVAGTPQTFSGLSNNGHVATGDFNEDGKLDVVLTNYGSASAKDDTDGSAAGKELTVLYGQGNGKFASPFHLTVGAKQHVSFAAVGDYDGDGHQDLICSSAEAATEGGFLTAFHGDGLGTFSKVAQVASGGKNAAWVGFGQLTADTKLDAIVVNFGQGDAANEAHTGVNFTVFTGDGAGGFAVANSVSPRVGFLPLAGAIADFTGDGSPDLAVVCPGIPANTGDPPVNGTVELFPGNGAGGFAVGNAFDSGGVYPDGLAVGDFNGDGKPDLAASNIGDPDNNFADTSVGVLLNSGGGNFGPVNALFDGVSTLGSRGAFAVATGDFNGDSKTDIAAVVYGPLAAKVPVYLGDGAGRFAADPDSPFATGSLGGQYLAVGEFDANASPDIVTVGAFNQVVTLLNQTPGGVGAVATTTAAQTSAASVAYGTAFTLTATVTAGGAAPTGTVTFLNGSTVLGTGTLNGSGVATFAVPGTALNAAAYTLTARYDGAAGFGGSSATVAQTVTAVAPAVTLAAPATAAPGQSVTLTATVSSAAGTPGGTVTFLEGSTALGTGALSTTAGVTTATFPTSWVAAGPHAVTARYEAAGNFATATSAAATVTVTAAPGPVATTVTLSSSLNPSPTGTVTITAAVAATSGTPTGTVTLYDGATPVGVPTALTTVGGQRQAAFPVTLAAGGHTLSAHYSGAAGFAASDSPAFDQQIVPPAVPAATATGVTASPAAGTYGQPVTFTAVVSATAGTPTGQVQFYRGATPLGGPVALAAVGGQQQATFTAAGGALAVGPVAISARYLGAAGFAASDAAPIGFVVDPAAADVAVSGGGSSAAGGAVTFTVTVSSAAGTPTGPVTLYDGNTPIAGPADLQPVGGRQQVGFAVSSLAPGAHAITARYAGGGNYAAGASAAVTHQVLRASATIGLTAGPAPVAEGETVTLTAAVTGPAGPLTGTVTFKLGTEVLGSRPVSGGSAVLTTTAVPRGTQTVTAEYGGDSTYLPATATAGLVVDPPKGRPPAGPKPLLTGYKEFAVGSGDGGTARFYNPDGSHRFDATPFPGFAGGVRVTSADFNGDGVADVVAGTGPGAATQVKVIDGVTQKTLFTTGPFEPAFTGGVFVTTGDVTGDGVPDLVVTPDEGGGPRVQVYSGAGYGKVADFFGIDDPAFRGGARAGIGDVNGDGVGDLVVSAGFGGGPRVAGFDGRTLGTTRGKLFADFFVFEQALRNGAYIAAGDVDGDGKADLVAGAGPGGGPRVLVLSAADLLGGKADGSKALANYFAGNVDNRGGVRVAVRDLDGDARADLVTGDGAGGGSRVTTYRGVAPTAVDLSFDAFAGDLSGVFVG